MKKLLIFGLIALLVVVGGFVVLANFFGKSIEERALENMSEWTKSYFYGEGETFSATISAGEREADYVMNGKSGKNVDFALLTLRSSEEMKNRVVKVDIKIGDEIISAQELELNTLNGTYMADIERSLTGDETISVTFVDEALALENLSKNFAIDDKKAVEIGVAELETQITKCKHGTNLGAECYLRVLDKQENGFDELFWCFTVVNTNGENFSAVISTKDGKVLAKSEEK